VGGGVAVTARAGVEAALSRVRPEFGDFAIVHDERNWHPVMPPEDSCWSFQLYGTLEVAKEVAAEWPPAEHPEVWARRAGAWAVVP
jgi:hypothetical protein